MKKIDKRTDNYTWKYEDVLGANHHGNAFTICSKSYLHKNVNTDIHSHEFYEINIVTAGSGKHLINGVLYDTKKGYVYVIPPHVKHKLISEDNLCVFHIIINNYFISKYKAELESLSGFYSLFNLSTAINDNRSFLHLNNSQFKEITCYCDLLLKEQSKDNQHVGIICNNIILILIYKFTKMITDNHATISLNNNSQISIVRVMDYINSNYGNNLNIDDIIKISFYSKTSFMKYFKEYTGTTLQKYVYSVRSMKAKEKMEAGITNITYIANECGFFDASHLNKHFKNAYGLTPKQFIKSLEINGNKS